MSELKVHRTQQHVQPYVGIDATGVIYGLVGVQTQYQHATLEHALTSYRHVLQRNSQITLGEFADKIAAVYDTQNPQTGEIVRVLRECANLPVATVH